MDEMSHPSSTAPMSFYLNDPPDHARSGLYLACAFPPRIKPTTILIVDHDAAVRDALSLTLRASGFGVNTFRSAAELLGDTSIEQAGCMLIEYDLEDMTGIELLTRLNARKIELPAIIMSARLRPLMLERRQPPGLITILQKPFGQEALLQCLRRALGHPRASDSIRNAT